ncbi:MAG: hypothetical protein U5L96_18155 [Owenweeksia sp.]|nr:hypothetical protein [Owenweeksia sp.]
MLAEATDGANSNGLGKSLVWKLVDFDVLTNYSSGFCEILTDDVLPAFILDDFLKGVSNGYKVNDPAITALNNNASQYEANLAKVAFYGEENRKMGFWRLLDTERKLRDPLVNTEAFMYGDNDDEGMFPFVQNSASRYYTRSKMFEALADLN